MAQFPVDPLIHRASTLPAAFYTDPQHFNDSLEKIFCKTWQFAGDEHLVQFPYDVFPFTLLEGSLNEPLLLTRNENDGIMCLSNVCTHRANLVVDNPGKKKKLVCGYHGRRFSLDGKFEHMPEFKEAENFPEACDDLAQIPLYRWRQFLFVNLNPAFDFHQVTDTMEEKIGFMPVEKFWYSPERSKSHIVNAHWALYCDNYLEGFHIPFVHPDLNNALEYNSYQTILYSYSNLQVGYSKDSTEIFDLPEGHTDHGKHVAAYYFWIFPNMMFNFYPWGLSLNIVNPISKDTCNVSFLTYVYDESKVDGSAGALLNKVEKEDEYVVESVQKGLRSRLYKRGRFSPTREQGVHHFHLLLSSFFDA